jgi:site-specific recombinase XerD
VSGLEQSLADYLQLRRSLGHQLDDAGRLLPCFVGFLDGRGLSTVTVAAAVEWAATPATATDQRSTVGPRRMTAVRGFARYLAGVDPATEVPPLGVLPLQASWRGPFVFSAADVDLILNRMSGFTPPLRSATYVTLIGLLAATGLRNGEDQTRPGRR